MTRVPYPGDIKRELHSKTRGRGMGYTFEVTKPIMAVILALVLITAVARTIVSVSAQTPLWEIASSFVRHLATTGIGAGVLLILAYVVFAPYQLYDGITSFFSWKQRKPRK